MRLFLICVMVFIMTILMWKINSTLYRIEQNLNSIEDKIGDFPENVEDTSLDENNVYRIIDTNRPSKGKIIKRDFDGKVLFKTCYDKTFWIEIEKLKIEHNGVCD